MTITSDPDVRAGVDPERFVAAAARIGAEVLAVHADHVDANARFPREAIDAMRDAGMLGALIPTHLGGLGMSLETVARATTEFGRHCSSAGMVFAMHQIQVAVVVKHGQSEAMQEFCRRIAESQLLLASATTEVGIGGDLSRSTCAVEPVDGRVALTKQAPVISYATAADAILATARRDPEAPANDQVIVVAGPGTYQLEPTNGWDALGFRGTCSEGFVLTIDASVDDVIDVAYSDISAATMLPVAHVLWSSLWLGMAASAEAKARKFVQQAARRNPGTTPPGALRLAELEAVFWQLRDLVEGARRRYEGSLDDDRADTVEYGIAMNSLKISASGLMVDIIQRALLICGMAGYSNASPLSLGRVLRDALGAQLMVNNDRILLNTSQMALMHRSTT